MKKLLAILMALAMMLSLVACNGGTAGGGDVDADDHFAGYNEEDVEYPITIKFWLCNTGNTQTFLLEAAEKFNKSQDKIIVEAEYGGSYRDVLLKMQTGTAADRPDIFHSDTEGAYEVYVDESLFVPLYEFVERDNYDTSNILSNLKNSYSDKEGNMLAMPLGNTAAGWFYNEDLLKANGIDPRTDLDSYAGVLEACRKLKAAGVATPFYMGTSSSYYTMAITAQGIQYVDNNNGKDGVPTKSMIGVEGSDCQKVTVEFFEWLKTMNEEGLMLPLGTTGADARAAFASGQSAIQCAFISSFNTYNNLVNEAGKPFQLGYRELPVITDGAEYKGSCVGGGCLFISDNGNVAKELAAWEFIKFLAEDEQAVGYSKASGYLPITISGGASADWQDHVKNVFPTAAYVMEAQENTVETCYNAWLPMFTDFHALCSEYYTLACSNPALTAEEVTAQFAAAVDECIEYYNLENAG